MVAALLLIVLLVAAVAALPVWSYSATWKLYASSACIGLAAIGALLVVVGLL